MRNMTWSVIIFFLSAIPSQAQMVNYKRRNQEPSQQGKLLKTSYVPSEKKVSFKTKPSVNKEINSPHFTLLEISHRFEKTFDQDEDGYLNEKEWKNLLRHTLSTVEQRGRMQTHSKLLEPFDADNDGMISRLEAPKIIDALQ